MFLTEKPLNWCSIIVCFYESHKPCKSLMNLPCMLSSAVGVTPIATLSAASPDMQIDNVHCPCKDLMAMVQRSLAVLCFLKTAAHVICDQPVYRTVSLCCLPHVPLGILLQRVCCSEACMHWRLDQAKYIRKTNMVTTSTCTVTDSQNQIILCSYVVTLIPARYLSCTDTPYQGTYIIVLSTILCQTQYINCSCCKRTQSAERGTGHATLQPWPN